MESCLANLSLSDDEGQLQDRRSIAEDSGVGEMSSDDDSSLEPIVMPDWSEADRGRTAKRLICRETGPQPGYPEGRGAYLMEYCDDRGERWLTPHRVTRNHPELKRKFLSARRKLRER